MTYLIRTLVLCCKARDIAWDPRKDILFLCQEYGEEVSTIRSQLDQKALQQNFLGTPFFARLSPEEQRKCYQVLLGTEPPPVMAVTPPAPVPVHKHSASASDMMSTPRAASHNAPPSVQGQSSPSFLGSSIPGKPSASRRVSSTDTTTAPTIPAPPRARESIPVDIYATTRDSRSRYRQISTPGNRDVSPLDAQHPVNVRYSRQQSRPAISTQQPLPNGLYQNAHYGLQTTLNLAYPPAVQNSRPMPSLNAGHSAPVPPQPFAQTGLLNGPSHLPLKTPNRISPVEMSASPVNFSFNQQHMKPQSDPEGGSWPKQHHASQFPTVDRPLLPLVGHVRNERPQRAGLPATTKIQSRTSELHVVNPDEQPRPVEPSDSAITTHTAPQLPTFPIELDAMSELGNFIAELSVDRRTPGPSSDFESMIPPPLNPQAKPTLQNSPVISANTALRPLNPRTSSAPLPAALLPGRSTTHDRIPSNSPPTSFSTSPPETNAARYTRYYTPPSSTPGSPQPTGMYKAYQPASQLILPASPPIVQEDVTPDTATPDRESRFLRLRDVDGRGEYVKRVSRSVDSRILAREYQAELPSFEHGYSSGGA
jgi:hypothetical protein